MQPLAATVLAAAWLLSFPAANAHAQSPQAQSPEAQTPSPDSSDQQPNVPDQKLDATAAAIRQVVAVKDDYQQRLDAADPSDKKRIAEEANSALVKAVTDQGLSVDEYASIMVVAQNDPAVRDKLVQRIRSSAK
jgi:Spy/CpxP family protein refolding chaperone